MIITISNDDHEAFLETARALFESQFSNELPAYEQNGYYKSISYIDSSNVRFFFTFDTLIRDVRLWGAAAIGCGLLTSFGVEV